MPARQLKSLASACRDQNRTVAAEGDCDIAQHCPASSVAPSSQHGHPRRVDRRDVGGGNVEMGST